MAQEKICIAFIGCGNLANRVHYPSLASFKDVELVACCDLISERRERTARRFSISRAYADYRRMIEETSPDAVYAILRPHHLFDPLLWVIQQGLPVFLEKPPGVTVGQTRSLARLAEKHSSLTMVGFNRRFIPLLVECRRRVEERGPIIQAVATFYKHMVDQPQYYDGAVDFLTSDVIHCVDTLRWLGGEVERVVSDVSWHYADYPSGFNALLKFTCPDRQAREGGATAHLLSSYEVGKRVHTFELHARGISAFVDPDSGARIYADGGAVEEVLDTREVAGSDEFRVYYGFTAEDRHFIDCVRGGTLPQTHLGDAVKTMELVDRIYHGQM
ncbi:MAG: Gfo/Idh/MocA family oxidoreductase [Chloroflexota bacterium]|nr:Gfo/Idh/MocA family oxidoreductase [Chloroflexota bacterium]